MGQAKLRGSLEDRKLKRKGSLYVLNQCTNSKTKRNRQIEMYNELRARVKAQQAKVKKEQEKETVNRIINQGKINEEKD